MTGPVSVVSVDHPAVRKLWGQVLAAYGAHVRQGSAISYYYGLRAGLANAYATVTGLSREQVAERVRDEIDGPMP